MFIARDTDVISHLFAGRYCYRGKYRGKTQVSQTIYGADSYVETALDPEVTDFAECLVPDRVNWFQVTGLSDEGVIYRMVESFGINPLDVKAIVTPNHAAKIDESPERLIIVMRSCIFEEENLVSSEHICVLAKDNIVITFTERDSSKFDNILESLRDDLMGIRNEDAGMLVGFIMNSIFSETIGTAVRVEEILEKIDDILLDTHHAGVDMGKKLQQCRHANLILLKNNAPLKNEFPKLFKTSIVRDDETMRQVFNELCNQLDFIVLTTNNSKELLSSMRDLYAASNDLRTNKIMQRLTVVSTLFIPITFLVGLWGMNYRIMPETEWKYGYLFALLVLVATLYGTWKYMKKNKWF